MTWEWRNLKHSFRAVSVQHQGKRYKKALLLVDDETREVEVQTERGLFRKKMEKLVNLGVVTKRILTAGDNVTIGGVAVVLESQMDVCTIAQLLYVPDVVKGLAVAKGSAEKFLRARSSALTPLIKLKVNPREALLGAFEEAPRDADPVDVLVSSSEKAVKDALEILRREVEAEARDLPPETRNRVYAVVYAVASVQDSYLKADESTRTGALGLLSLSSPGTYPSMSELEGMTPDEASELLLSSGFIGLTGSGASRSPS